MARPNEAPPSRLSLQLEDTLPRLPCGRDVVIAKRCALHVPLGSEAR
jgi:hypothetical protein